MVTPRGYTHHREPEIGSILHNKKSPEYQLKTLGDGSHVVRHRQDISSPVSSFLPLWTGVNACVVKPSQTKETTSVELWQCDSRIVADRVKKKKKDQCDDGLGRGCKMQVGSVTFRKRTLMKLPSQNRRDNQRWCDKPNTTFKVDGFGLRMCCVTVLYGPSCPSGPARHIR